MLCTDCEQRFSRDEGTFQKICLRGNGSFPARDGAVRVWESVGQPTILGTSHLDVPAVTRFASSVFWRAARSRKHFPKVSLGERFEAQFAAYLLGRGTFPAAATLLATVYRLPPGQVPVDRAMIAPFMTRLHGYHVHDFAFAGFRFKLFVGSMLPSYTLPLCLAANGRLFEVNGDDALAAIEGLYRKSTPRGKMAKGGP